jgi:outer membrane protein assembly factor BamB
MMVCAVLVILQFRGWWEDPLNSPQLARLKEQLLASPKDEGVKAQIRQLDLQLRNRYFRHLRANKSGAFLAAGAFGLSLLAMHQVVKSRQRPPMPQPDPNASAFRERTRVLSRRGVTVVGACAGAALLAAAWVRSTDLPDSVAGVERLLQGGAAGAQAVADFASADEMHRNWPFFRGPEGTGVARCTIAPSQWDAETGRGIVWKSAVPASGFNSPIVWGDRVFLSGGDAEARHVLCYDATTGQLLWQHQVQDVPGSPAEPPDLPEQTGYAAPTMATDGRRVYAIFANGDLAALTFGGQRVWAKNLGVPKNPHGHAASLTTWQGRVIVQLDQGEPEQNLSKLYAIDGPTGRVVWQQSRPVAASWATPIVIEAAGTAQIITLAVPWVMAYSAKDGVELWRAGELTGEITPSPVIGGGFVLAVIPYDRMLAIRPDGHGDVTQTHIAWFAEDNMPDITSPVTNGELVFTLSTPGMLACFDVKDGNKLWEQELGIECNASPTLAAGRLYVTCGNGLVLVVEAGRAWKELGRNDLKEPLFASPAFVEGRIFFRGSQHLFCIGPERTLAARP